MWRMIGFKELDEMPEKGGEGITGRKYNKGFIFAPRNMVSWDVDTVDNKGIPTNSFSSSPVTIDEFTKTVLTALDNDSATLISKFHYSLGRELDNKILLTIATHMAFSGLSNGNGDKVQRLLRTLHPRYITKYGGRKRAFAALSTCLSYLNQFMDELSSHYPQYFKDYMLAAREPIIGAGGSNLALPHIISWSGTRYMEQYGGLISIGGYEKRGSATISLESLTSALKEELETEEIHDSDLFAGYVGAKVHRNIVAVFRRYKASRWGVQPRKEEVKIIAPLELGLSNKDLAYLTNESLTRYKRILEKERVTHPIIK